MTIAKQGIPTPAQVDEVVQAGSLPPTLPLTESAAPGSQEAFTHAQADQVAQTKSQPLISLYLPTPEQAPPTPPIPVVTELAASNIATMAPAAQLEEVAQAVSHPTVPDSTKIQAPNAPGPAGEAAQAHPQAPGVSTPALDIPEIGSPVDDNALTKSVNKSNVEGSSPWMRVKRFLF